ncbi:hypothetical protein ACFLZX_03225 [Nanoarchaeota archaeon]
MESSLLKGICYGLTSGVITTLGLIVGLNSFTESKLFIIGGVLTIAIADSFSDSLGIHISEESSNKSHKGVWKATLSTFFAKMLFSLTFIVPIMMFDYPISVYVSIGWGFLLLGLLSYYIATMNKTNPIKVILEHLGIALVVVVLTHYIGDFISLVFV